jgi:hypothetical protein
MTFTVFTGGDAGAWNILSIAPVIGESLIAASHLEIASSASLGDASAKPWQFRGVTSHVRYVERAEKIALTSAQAGLGRAEATRAALIPIKKSAHGGS